MCQQNLENSAVATGLERVSFHSNPKKGNTKECSKYYTIALISHTSKMMLKILQVSLQQSNYGKFLNMGTADHLTCLLRNLYAGQEATVRVGQETTDCFQIGKGVAKVILLM